ncbi:MAG: hypothetical protein Q7R31_01480 [Candidatus Levybacteria bacterium]|nr:hypothetical protein [Candidatus Levybacteria bacterium]
MDNVSQPIPQQAPVQPEIPPTNSNSNWLKTLAIGFGIVSIGTAIAVGGYFLGTKNSQPVIESKIVVQPSPTPADETANWKTYTDKNHLYSIRYPVEFTTTISDSKSNVMDASGAFNLAISTELTNLDLNSYVDQKSSCSEINSKNGISYIIDSKNSLRFEQTPCGQTGSTDIYTINNGVAYHFSIATQANYDSYLKTLNQILSTFKFTNQNQTVDPTANWKTYTNGSLKFSVKYPNSWNEKGPISNNDNTLVYLNANESFGQGPEPVKYYVWITADNLPNVKLTKESIGEYTVYKTNELPSRSGALNAFITEDGKKYISVSLTPYDLKQPFPSQDKYVDIFNQILSTFRFAN